MPYNAASVRLAITANGPTAWRQRVSTGKLMDLEGILYARRIMRDGPGDL
jgi:hypothetical protein